ncbi:hypothetical protein EDB85DRAFT_1896672 [Lactarius pseudohatsudake]|nr:hypothetical protein EDB85DRAFT_1896672 [Lactarius pseudohatsudake]
MATSDQCAVAADGSLLNASAIPFYNDPDDDNPLPTSSTTSNSATPRQGGPPAKPPAPSKITAGSRHSGRIPRPSSHLTDPNNLEALGFVVTCKQSATVTALAPTEGPQALHAAHHPKLTNSNNESEDNKKSDDVEEVEVVDVGDSKNTRVGSNCDATTDSEEEGTDGDSTKFEQVTDSEAYHATKAMGDADRQFLGKRCHTSKRTLTADVRTIFKYNKNSINPITNEIEEGNWCTISRSQQEKLLLHQKCLNSAHLHR